MSRLTQIKKLISDAGDIPDGVQFYLFGSSLRGLVQSDIDLLCVYDAARIAPESAYSILNPLFEMLYSRCGSPVHPVILTKAEEIQVRFIEAEECVLISD
jgi:predicted nucleotidyltransferase